MREYQVRSHVAIIGIRMFIIWYNIVFMHGYCFNRIDKKKVGPMYQVEKTNDN